MSLAPARFALCRRRFLALATATTLFGGAAGAWAAEPKPLTVFAAASLKTVLDEIGGDFTVATGIPVRVVPAGSSTLARQIAHGAPADVFISANRDWMDVLAAENRIRPETRIDLLSNRLVLISPAGQAAGLAKLSSATITTRLGSSGRLAMALVDSVPAGIYGKAALETEGVWPAVAPHVAQADNVRAALALVATGAAPLGVVYATDAQAEPRVEIVAELPAESHPQILYPAAAVTAGNVDGATRFLAHLKKSKSQRVFAAHGFRPARTF